MLKVLDKIRKSYSNEKKFITVESSAAQTVRKPARDGWSKPSKMRSAREKSHRKETVSFHKAKLQFLFAIWNSFRETIL